MKKIIKILIFIICIICIICIIVLSILSKEEKNTVNFNKIEEVQIASNPDEVIKESYIIEKEKNPTRFYTVQECIQKYIDYISNDDAQAVLDILNKEYIEQNDINLNNVINSVSIYSESEFNAMQIETLMGNVSAQYRVYGYALDNNNNKEHLYYKVKLDLNNMTFEITPFHSDILETLSDIELIEDNSEIIENENNKFVYKEVNREDMCRVYQRYYVNLEKNDIQEAYSLLETEYKNRRFPKIEDFNNYINENIEAIEKATLARYSVDIKEDKTIYTLVDSYNNYYVIEEDSIMNFSIKLDSYTVPDENYEVEYAKLSDSEKTSANLGVFMQMLNSKDYLAAYEKLSDGFKSNYFPTLQDFINYTKLNFYYVNDYEISNFKNEGNIYIYTVSLKDHNALRDESDIQKTFNIQLKENIDFEISFNV